MHRELLPAGQTINATVYCQQLSRVHEKLKTLDPALLNRKGVLLLQDNAKTHVARMTRAPFYALDGKHYCIRHTPRTLHRPIITCSIPWTITFEDASSNPYLRCKMHLIPSSLHGPPSSIAMESMAFQDVGRRSSMLMGTIFDLPGTS